MSHPDMSDFELVREMELSLFHSHERQSAFLDSMLSQDAQIIKKIYVNNMQSSIQDRTLLLKRSFTVIDFLDVAMSVHFIQDSDDNFLRKIKVKKSAKYLDKSLQEHNK